MQPSPALPFPKSGAATAGWRGQRGQRDGSPGGTSQLPWWLQAAPRLLLGEITSRTTVRAQELCESPGGRPGLPVHNSPCGVRGCKATMNSVRGKTQELCESRGGRPGLPVPNSPYGLCGRNATLNSNRTMGNNDRLYLLKRQNIIGEELNTQSRLQGDTIISRDSSGRPSPSQCIILPVSVSHPFNVLDQRRDLNINSHWFPAALTAWRMGLGSRSERLLVIVFVVVDDEQLHYNVVKTKQKQKTRRII